MDSEDGQIFIKRLAGFVRTHEKALANALQLQQRRQPVRRGSEIPGSPRTPIVSSAREPSSLSSAFSLPALPFTSQSLKPAKLSLTPHHLYYLLSRFEDLNIPVGPMNVRLENIHSDAAPSNYVSFLRNSSARRNRSSDSLSMHSVSSVRSVMSGMSSLWSNFGFGAGSITSRNEKAKAALDADLKYLYSAFTKIPCLRLAPDRKARLVAGFEEFPLDTAVPLLAFKNVSALEICDIDIRQFFGWDRLAEQLRSLVVKRAAIEDPAELLIAIVLDDMDRRRRRSAKTSSPPPIASYPSPPPPPLPLPSSSSSSPSTPAQQAQQAHSAAPSSSDALPSPSSPPRSPSSPSATGAQSQSAPAAHYHPMSRRPSESSRSSSRKKDRPRSSSPTTTTTTTSTLPAAAAQAAAAAVAVSRHTSHRMRRSGSSSSHSSAASTILPQPSCSSSSSSSSSSPSHPLTVPPTKWRFLRHLSLSENGLHAIASAALVPLSGSLTSLDLSNNLFASIPECLSILTNLRALNLSGNMIDSLHSLTRSPLPAITSLNLRANRLASIAGIERALTLERLDLRQNRLADPTELTRLTGAPNFTAVWVEGNPFAKTHPGYRVAIFNLFRSTPGYTDDIDLDSQGPGMMEKRSLVERAAETPGVPVIRLPKQQALTVHQVAPLDARSKKARAEEEKRRAAAGQEAAGLAAAGEVARAKKKAGRRRVVEFSRDDGLPSDNRSVRTVVRSPVGSTTATAATATATSTSTTPTAATTTTTTTAATTNTTASAAAAAAKKHGPIAIEVNAQQQEEASSGAESSPPDEHKHVDWSVRGDEYRRKVEALKNEVGSGWLSVLSEEGLSLASTRKSTR